MQKINIRRLYLRFKRDYLNLNNAVILIAFIIAANWVWGSLNMMERNYKLQKELDDKSRQLVVAQLDNENAKLQQRYYKTNEYMELAVREKLGLVIPGEHVLILPKSSEAARNESEKTSPLRSDIKVEEVSNFRQWMDFLFGGNSRKLSD